MTIPRSVIELALDELVSNQEGMRFQGLAVVLAKLRWPEFIACERQKDLGLDAYAPSSLSPGAVGKGLACSITASLNKIQNDARSAKENYPDLQVLVFATPRKVSKQLEQSWKKSITKEFGWELHVVSREDIITSLQLPENASLCATHLGIPAPAPEGSDVLLLDRIRAANLDVVTGWSRSIEGKPVIDLRLVLLDEQGAETQETIQLLELLRLLGESRRIVIEAPAGRGKTTTLIQLARQHQDASRIAFLIDLPSWIRRNVGIFDFLAGMHEFQSRGISAQQLSFLYRTQQVSFLLNGWNELAQAESVDGATRIREIERSFPKAGIVIATRSHPGTPQLPGSSRFKIPALDSAERAAYLKARLGRLAPELLNHVSGDAVLNDLTTTPLVLAEIASLFEAQKPIPTSKLGVLKAVTRLMEERGEHPEALERPPLRGLAWRYLEELGHWLTANGGVQIPEAQARTLVSSVAHDLVSEGQLTAIPEPDDLLTALTAHDVLERSTYPGISFLFFHQQFQELFAALRLRRELNAIVDSTEGQNDFTAKYVNEPAWSEPLYMLAGSLREESAENGVSDPALIGAALAEMALKVDPIFASELAMLGGPQVWNLVRVPVGRRLRQLHQSPSELSRNIAITSMLATGSQDFKDVIVPLLSSENRSTRLDVYRTWEPFPVSIVGEDWMQVVRGWNEGARADFVATVLGQISQPGQVVGFALSDPAPSVREIPLSMVWYRMPSDELERYAATLNDGDFWTLIKRMPESYMPDQLRSRAAAMYVSRAERQSNTYLRLVAWSKAVELGAAAIDELKKELLSATAADVEKLVRNTSVSAIDSIRRADPDWMSAWAAERIASGFIKGVYWLDLVQGISPDFKDLLLERITAASPDSKPDFGSIALLSKFAYADLVKALFRRISHLRAIIDESRMRDDKRTLAETVRQLENVLEDVPPQIVLASILDDIDRSDVAGLKSVLHLFRATAPDRGTLRDELTPELREKFSAYLRSMLDAVLAEQDFGGGLKSDLATVLAKVGEPSDLRIMERLIEADIERRRQGRIAYAGGIEAARNGRMPYRQSEQASGSAMSWSSWYTRAVVDLIGYEARGLLVRLLNEPDYEIDSAWSLFILARREPPPPGQFMRSWPMRTRPFARIWDIRAGQGESDFDESRRTEIAAALKTHIESVMAASHEQQPTGFTYRLKELAVILAELDGRASSDLILETLCLTEPSKWLHDGWTKINAMEALLISGAPLPFERTCTILEPILEHVRAHQWDEQQRAMRTHCLRILLLTDRPSLGLGRVREIIQQTPLHYNEVGQLVSDLGLSRAEGALEVLRDLADGTIPAPFSSIQEAWIDAVARIDTRDARDMLMSFIDPSLSQLPREILAGREDRLALRLAELASRDAAAERRILALVRERLSLEQSSLLGKTLTQLATPDALLAALELLDDDAPNSVSYELSQRIEESFLERRPYRELPHAFTFLPRSSNAVRNRLWSLFQHDKRRRKSAYALLMQIESWRNDHGRPEGEPRCPALASGVSWPPEPPTA